MISRRALLGSLAGATGLALAGCAGGQTPTSGGGSSAPEAFPATLPNVFGETVVEAAPSTVYSLGYTDHDALMVLGVLPVAITQWFAEYAIGPWATETRKALDGPDPAVLKGTDGTNLEAVAAAGPDLITSYYSGIEAEEYDNLTKLAPVLVRPPDTKPWSSEWSEQLTAIGAALGKAERAQELLDDVNQKFADARAAHPEFAGKTLSLALPGDGGSMFVYTKLDPRYRVLEQLGFTLPDALADHPDADKDFYLTISAEQVSLMDADVVGVITRPEQRAALERDAVWQQVPAVAAGRSFTLDVAEVGAALSFGTVLSVPYALAAVVEVIAALPRA